MSTPTAAAPRMQRPETVRLMVAAWWAALGLEFLHQILQAWLMVLSRDELTAQMRRQFEERGTGIPEELLPMAVIGGIGLSAFVAISLLTLLAIMLGVVQRGSKRAGFGRRLLFAFSIYFGLRIFLVFMARPSGSSVPETLFVFDGMVQILVGVAAVIGAILSTKKETLDYTGELEQLRALEEEARKRQESKK